MKEEVQDMNEKNATQKTDDGGGRPQVAADTTYDPMPSPAEAYANTGQANPTPGQDSPPEDHDADAIGSNYPSVRKGGSRDEAGRSGVGRQERSASDIEQRLGDGHSLRAGDRKIPFGGAGTPAASDLAHMPNG